MNEILSVKNLQVSYESINGWVYAVRGVSFTINRGEVFGILGESGSGKTTICQALMGLVREGARISGKITLNGREILTLKEKELRKLYSKEIALLPQGIHSLNPLLTVGAHVEETTRSHSSKRERRNLRENVLNLLKQFQLSDNERVYDSYPYQLSGGMIQRSTMAVCFSCFPSLVIADEPTRGLDPKIREDVLDTIKRMQADHDFSVLLVTHDLEAAERICDRVAVIYAGRFVETGRIEDVLCRPLHPYTQSLIKAMPKNGMHPTWGFAPSSLNNDKSCSFQPRCAVGKNIDQKHIVLSPVRVGKDHFVWCVSVKR